MICPHCGKEHPDAAIFCPETGKSISREAVCPHCGQVHPVGAQFCPITGSRITGAGEPQTAVAGKKTNRFFTFALPILVVVCLALGATGVFALSKLPVEMIPFIDNIFPEIPGTPTAMEQTLTPSKTPNTVQPTRTKSLPPTDVPTHLPTSTKRPTITPSPTLDPENPIGKIVYTCQIFKDSARNQICIVNADGTNQRRLTADDYSDHYYASLSPDGLSIVFSSNQAGTYEIYEMDLQGNQRKLTSLGKVYAPEISPDGQSIVFTNGTGLFQSIWVMDRNGQSPHPILEREGVNAVDPTWSPTAAKYYLRWDLK